MIKSWITDLRWFHDHGARLIIAQHHKRHSLVIFIGLSMRYFPLFLKRNPDVIHIKTDKTEICAIQRIDPPLCLCMNIGIIIP